MEILGVPDDVDPSTVRPTGEWRLSARTERALTLRQKLVDRAYAAATEATDDQLRAWIIANLAEGDRIRAEMDKTHGTQAVELHDPNDDPDPAAMTREAAGLDIVTVSQRLGHASPAITLTVYAHRFGAKDTVAASVIDAAMRP